MCVPVPVSARVLPDDLHLVRRLQIVPRSHWLPVNRLPNIVCLDVVAVAVAPRRRARELVRALDVSLVVVALAVVNHVRPRDRILAIYVRPLFSI